jgi:ketosteroid isomerase-like protein
MERPSAEHAQWLQDFATAVRRRDLEAGRALCDGAIHSFGTVCWRSEDLDTLVREQWEQIWPHTRDFDFDSETVRAAASGDVAVLVTTWSSRGLDADGTLFPRRGRATIVLGRQGDDWKAIHTHFSLDPATRGPGTVREPGRG